MSEMDDDLLANIRPLAAAVQEQHNHAVQQLAPVVQQLLTSQSRDVNRNEHTLDHLLDHAGHPDALTLFRSLCRHYYTFAPQAAAEYVRLYRDLWDSDE